MIAAAIVEAGHAVSDRSEWFEAVRRHPWRSDFRPRVESVAKILSLNADSQMLAAPGIDNLSRVAGLGRRQVFRVIARLRSAGFLGWVSAGSTSGRKWRATYVLTSPEPMIEKVSPRLDPPLKSNLCAREASWRESKALQWVRRRYAAGWTDRQFRTAVEYPPDLSRPYGSPEGRSLWRVLRWRVMRFRDSSGAFVGREAVFAQAVGNTGAVERMRDDWAEWEEEMAKPGASEMLEKAKTRALEAVRHARADRLARNGGRRVAWEYGTNTRTGDLGGGAHL